MNFVKASTKSTPVDTGSTAGGGAAGGDGQRAGLGAGGGSTPANQQPDFKPVTYDRDWGKFEKHTKGFGSKYLAKFNFKGRLGKQEQGITRPISVMTRLPGAGLGAVKEATNLRENKEIMEDIFGVQENDDKAEKGDNDASGEVEVPLWQRAYGSAGANHYGHEHGKKKKRKRERTRPPIAGLAGASVSEPKKKTIKKKAYGAELMYNLKVLHGLAEDKVINARREMGFTETNLHALKATREAAEEWVQREEEKVLNLQSAKRMLVGCQELVKGDEGVVADSQGGEIDAEWITALGTRLEQLRQRHREFFFVYKVRRLIPSLVTSRLQRTLSCWEPLREPSCIVSFMAKLRLLFGKDRMPESSRNRLNMYDGIVENAILPAVREDLVRSWNPCDYIDEGVQLMDSVTKFACAFHVEGLLEEQVVPKLKRQLALHGEGGVADANALRPDIWIHPWLPLLKDKATQLCSALRPVLTQHLNKSYRSAGLNQVTIDIIAPWKGVYAHSFVDRIINRSILPKLIDSMHDCKSSLASIDCKFRQLKTLMKWEGLIGKKNVFCLLEGEFFPHCYRGLKKLLEGSPQFENILSWYERLKSSFPTHVLDGNEYSPKARINGLLEIVNVALTADKNMDGVPLPEFSSYERILRSINGSIGVVKPKLRMHKPNFQTRINLKKLMMIEAEKNNLVFAPRLEHKVGGKQVYYFGKEQMYIDANVVFCRSDADPACWSATSIDNLVCRASSKTKAPVVPASRANVAAGISDLD